MARYDKYDPISGGFRAQLGQALVATDDDATNQVGVPLGVGLNAQGLLVVGGGNTGIIGVFVADQPKVIGDIADVMTAGDIVDVDDVVFAPGGVYAADPATGVITAGGTGSTIGYAVGDRSVTTGDVRPRLVVRVNFAAPAAP